MTKQFYFNEQKSIDNSLLIYLLTKNLISLNWAIRITYLFWFFLGFFGVHNFLLARYGVGLTQLFFASFGIAIFPWGVPLFIVPIILLLIDAFLIKALIFNSYQSILDEQSNPRIIDQ